MAQNAPNCKDTQEIQFKLHDKFLAFRKCGDPRSNVNLLAVSSSRGLLFAGNPNAPELKIIIVKDIAAAKTSGKQPLARLVNLPNKPNIISCSADGNLLAINYTQPNGTSMLPIYAVQSFMSPEVRIVYNIRLAPEDNVLGLQLLWNPVLPNSLAVVLSNGGLAMYALKDGGNFEVHSLDKSQQVKCGCWSPKGKQLVLGFPSGRLQQFKPDLTPAKTLPCPPNVHDGPFDTIAVHWLSTFQFAVIFLQQGEDCNPALYIVNAPKAGVPTYTNYYDICYSLNGPRSHQFQFTHVPQWNLLLVSSANGVEVGVLGTSETGDTPSWQQLTLLDEARIEMPLSEATQEETFPLGFAMDISSTHQLSINDQQLPTMPMVHVLGTDGTLLTFNFLNLQPGAVSICSPPPPLADTSGKFVTLDALLGAEQQPPAAASAAVAPAAPAASVEASTPAPLQDMSFAFTSNIVTSTPAPTKDKPSSMFAGFAASEANKMPSTFSSGSTVPLSFGAAAANSMPAPSFGGFGAGKAAPTASTSMFSLPVGGNSAPSFGNLKAAAPAQQPLSTMPSAASVANKGTSSSKPLYTVPPIFTPAPAATATPKQPPAASKSSDFSAGEVDDVIVEIMNVQISAFTEQIEQQKQQTRAVLAQIESPSTIKSYAKRLEDLQELNDQANDVDFELDVQGLRHALSEAYVMTADCRAKLEVFKKPDITRLMTSTNFDAAGRRILSRLQSYLAANQAQLQQVQQQIDAQWEQYQDVLRRNSKSKMNMPCLEGIYQRLTRLQNSTSDQRILLNNIKSKLKERGLLQSAMLNQESSRNRTNEAVDTLADSILSMNLSHVVDTNRAKLSQQKLKSIRQLLQQRPVTVIRPQRPDRVGLKSEVILETKLKAELKKKTETQAAAATTAAARAKPAVAHKATQAAAAVPTQLAKPTASKPTTSKPAGTAAGEKAQSVPAVAPALAPTPAPSSFSFSQSSPFVKTTASTVTTTTVSSGEAAQPKSSFFGGAAPFSFGGAKPMMSFGDQSATSTSQSPAAAASSPFAGFGNLSVSVEAAKPKPSATPPKEVSVKPAETKKDMPPPVDLSAPAAAVTESAKTQAPSSGAAKAEPAGKPFSFSGFGSNAGSTVGGGSSTFSFGGFGGSLFAATTSAPAAAPAVAPQAATTTTASSSKPATTAAPTVTEAATVATPAAGSDAASSSSAGSTTSSAASITTSSALPIDNLFGSVNICKPQSKDNAAVTAPANIFSGFRQSATSSFPAVSAAGDASKSLFGGSVSTGVAVSQPAATLATTTTAASTGSTLASAAPTAATATPTVALPTPSGTPVATPSTSAAPTVAGATTAPTSTAMGVSSTNAAAAPGSSFSFANSFSNLGTTSGASGGSTAATSSATSVTSSTPGSVFGGSNAFTPATTVSSPFGVTAPTAASASQPPSGNIFGNVPKPEASVFATSPAAPPTGLFAAAATSNPLPFGSSPAAPAATGGSIFGQATALKPSGFGTAASGGSIFGGGSSAGSPSLFGGGAVGGSSIFGGAGNNTQSPPAAAPSGPIFGQSVFGQSAASGGGNLFGNASSAQTQPSAFGGGGSIFGGAASTTSPISSGGSIFGGGSSSGGFGSFSQTTPTPGAFGGGGVFGQSGGNSVAQSGFGSPQQQTQPPTVAFGAKPVFGGSPAFGASPTFGGAPTFGSPKGFGTFGTSSGIVAPPAFGAPAKPPEGNIFETLGGTDTGLSFGNLAQTSNPNNQKPSYGGSSFMTYR
ncbi:nuclear pore complex protein Nup214 [Drosophila mojavensis]|uniref:nuclear pore complex protein Nup214 n=1 Tax=Drosophila mojavensis TaxID=7230 RepID=UPI00017C9B7A|nr:nuclear pore complex protein Nup214 [Drosophila mojavensis]